MNNEEKAAWFSNHPVWLRQSHHRCALFPWLPVGKVGDRYHPYDCHHLHYRNYGNEQLGRDVVVLSRFAHRHIVHGICSGYRRAGRQRRYPNAAQSALHQWCRLPLLVKLLAIAIATGVATGYPIGYWGFLALAGTQ